MNGHWSLTERSGRLWAQRAKPPAATSAAADHGWSRAFLVEDPPAALGGDDEAGEEDQQVEAGFRGAFAERYLRVHAGEEEERDEGDHQQEEDRVVDREGAVGEDADLHQRELGPQLVEDEGDEQGDAGGDAEPGGRAAPAPDARLLQPEHGEPHAAGDQHRAAVVERRRVLFVGRLGDRGEDEGDDRDRDVDPEDRPPGPLGQVAAGDRADRGEGAGEAEEDRQRPAALADREGAEDDRQRRREHQRRAGPLDHAEGDHPGLGRAARPASPRRAPRRWRR